MQKVNKIILRVIIPVGCFLLAGNGLVQAEPFMNIYFKAIKDKSSKEYIMIAYYLEAMGTGIKWANKALAIKEGKELFCPPKDVNLNATNYIFLINKYLDNNPSVKKVAEGKTIGSIQILSLIEAFPCTELESLK